MRPSTQPAMIAMVRPATTYSSAMSQPKVVHSRPIAISLTSGDAMRKLSVTPIGTPAPTKPMKAGTAEHEQNGVATPRPAAMTLPMPSRLPPKSARVRSIVMKVRSTPTTKMIPVSSSAILVVSYRKKCRADAGRASGFRPMRSKRSQSHMRSLSA